jgi:hypothetical protein
MARTKEMGPGLWTRAFRHIKSSFLQRAAATSQDKELEDAKDKLAELQQKFDEKDLDCNKELDSLKEKLQKMNINVHAIEMRPETELLQQKQAELASRRVEIQKLQNADPDNRVFNEGDRVYCHDKYVKVKELHLATNTYLVQYENGQVDDRVARCSLFSPSEFVETRLTKEDQELKPIIIPSDYLKNKESHNYGWGISKPYGEICNVSKASTQIQEGLRAKGIKDGMSIVKIEWNGSPGSDGNPYQGQYKQEVLEQAFNTADEIKLTLAPRPCPS